MTAAARTEHIAKALEAWEQSADRLTERVHYRGQQKNLPVVRVALDATVLNHRSHRIQAELESHEKHDAIFENPEAAESQQEIAELLRRTPGFTDLKANLNEEGQRDPGVITHTGLLVNANTRAVALDDLNEQYLEVAVLPTDASDSDIDDVELSLQMARDLRQDYSFTNQLRFIHDLHEKQGYTLEQIARFTNYAASDAPKDLPKGVRRVAQELRLLSMIRDIQKMSNPSLPLTFFEDRRQLLLDIDGKYESGKKKDHQEALRVRDTQLLGLFTENTGYRDLRKVESNFFEDYLVPEMAEIDDLKPVIDSLQREGATEADVGGDFGLDDLFGEDDTDADAAPTIEPHELLRLLSTSSADATLELTGPDGQTHTVNRERLVDTIDTSLGRAIETFAQDNSTQNRLEQPAEHLKRANSSVSKAKAGFADAKAHGDFDGEAFRDELARLQRQIGSLTRSVTDTYGDTAGSP